VPPKPPPTRFAITRTWSFSRPKTRLISSRVRKGTWVLVRSTSRPVRESSQPIVVCVSSATCCTRWVANVPVYTSSASANPVAASPTWRWISAQTLPAAWPGAAWPGVSWPGAVSSACRSGAPGAIAAAGLVTAGLTS
jgi:hypothetical protein